MPTSSRPSSAPATPVARASVADGWDRWDPRVNAGDRSLGRAHRPGRTGGSASATGVGRRLGLVGPCAARCRRGRRPAAQRRRRMHLGVRHRRRGRRHPPHHRPSRRPRPPVRGDGHRVADTEAARRPAAPPRRHRALARRRQHLAEARDRLHARDDHPARTTGPPARWPRGSRSAAGVASSSPPMAATPGKRWERALTVRCPTWSSSSSPPPTTPSGRCAPEAACCAPRPKTGRGPRRYRPTPTSALPRSHSPRHQCATRPCPSMRRWSVTGPRDHDARSSIGDMTTVGTTIGRRVRRYLRTSRSCDRLDQRRHVLRYPGGGFRALAASFPRAAMSAKRSRRSRRKTASSPAAWQRATLSWPVPRPPRMNGPVERNRHAVFRTGRRDQAAHASACWPAVAPIGRLPAFLLVAKPLQRTEPMTEKLRRLRRALADLVAEDRPGFKRIDASPALQDDGAWLKPRN